MRQTIRHPSGVRAGDDTNRKMREEIETVENEILKRIWEILTPIKRKC
jgi:hypothetical protein